MGHLFEPYLTVERSFQSHQCPVEELRISPAQEAGERQADRISIPDHADHLQNPHVLELCGHVEAVEHIRLSGVVGPDTLNKVRRTRLQLTGDLTQRVLERERAAGKDR